MPLYALENLSSQTTKECTPWEFESARPSRDAWSTPALSHCFYSGFSGGAPELRVGKSNPPVLCHALVADFDAPAVETDLVETLHKRSKSILPVQVGRTSSDGVRCVWLLEKPIPVQAALAKSFLKYTAKKLGVAKLFAGLDLPAFSDPYKYYEVGHSWQPVSNKLIDHAQASQWLVESAQSFDWKKEDVVIPLDKVADRVSALFPSKWQGTFSEGARGPRFWDPSADNSTAAVVRPSGMQCFTGLQAFVPWRQILGASWVAEFEQERIGSSVTSIWYDGQYYWVQGKAGHRACTRADTISHLKVNLGLSSIPAGGGASEAETAIVRIQETQHVEGAVKLPCKPVGLIHTADGRYLNTCDRQVCQPTGEAVTGSASFPFIHSLLEHLCGHRDEQLYHLVAWIQRFYRTGYELDLKPGQVLFLCGPTEVGKTLFSTVLLSRLVGGHMDASDYLTGSTDWNSDLIQRPLWTVDDVAALRDRQSYARWNSSLKKMAANRTFTVHEKYRKSISVNWAGRVVVTLNNDPESMRILPDLDISNSDKVMLIRCGYKKLAFPSNVADVLTAELPAFAKFLLDWDAPSEVVASSRFGVASYIDEDMESEARMAATSHAFLELLRAFFIDMELDEPLVGSSTQILAHLTNDASSVQVVARGYNNRVVGRELGKLQATYPKIISRSIKHHGREWTIDPCIKD